MKKLLFLLLMVLGIFSFSPEANATHFAGGEIWYEYVGTPQNPNRYDVYLIIYRDQSGATLCTGGNCSVNICIRSSCFGPINANAPLLPFNLQPNSDTTAGSFPGSIVTPELTDCIDPNSPNLVVTEAYRFYTQVDLPSTCADIVFSFAGINRNPSTNLVAANTRRLYLEAKLNNTLGHNSSPKFLNPAAKSFCVGTPFIWSQAAVEPDGDVLVYGFGNPLDGPCGGPPTNIPFATGYSVNQPMTTTSGITFNTTNGVLRFTPAQPEVVVINITIEEYRQDPVTGIMVVNGTSVRDLQIPVVAGCRSSAQNGPQIATGNLPTNPLNGNDIRGMGFAKISNPDSVADPNNPGEYLYNLPVIDYSCFDQSIKIEFEKGVFCETISPDGSEFRLIGPDSVARPVIAVNDNCRPDLVTKEIDLVLHKPLDVNGDYLLQIKNGSDGNTLTNKCGFPMDPFFMVVVRVNDCPTPDYKLNNVSVNLDREIDIDWEIDINSFEPSLFTAWNILRANSNGQYYLLESLSGPGDVNLRSYKDNTVTAQDVDLTQFQYRVQLVQNGTAFPPSNRIHSILLESTEKASADGQDYSWSVYDGWADPDYELEYGRFNVASQQMDWANFNGPALSYLNDEFFYPSCSENQDTSGLYAFRVIAGDPNNPQNSFTSESNWLYYSIDCPKDPDRGQLNAEIPSVFTPNGDGENDLFKIETDFESADVAIYNRWGKLVYSISGAAESVNWDGTDQGSGQLVADGVYYYVIGLKGEIDDGFGGKEIVSSDETGTLTIFSNGTK